MYKKKQKQKQKQNKTKKKKKGTQKGRKKKKKKGTRNMERLAHQYIAFLSLLVLSTVEKVAIFFFLKWLSTRAFVYLFIYLFDIL